MADNRNDIFNTMNTDILNSVLSEQEKNNVPNFQHDRILVAINQADVAMKGRHWDNFYNRPDSTLENFLREQSDSVKRRVKESTGVNIITPVCYRRIRLQRQ